MASVIAGNINRVGIIGARVAGLATAKTLLAENIDCVVLERGDRVGGVWADGYLNVGVQVQKELYEFPDWPLPPDTPDFTPGPLFQRYLEDYCDEFGLRPHLRLRSEVTSLEPRRDGAPGWDVTITMGGESTTEQFDLVVVASGLYSGTPHIPDYPARGLFDGELLHVSGLKSRAPLEGRRIAVIGYGKSATDAAIEAAGVAKEVHLIFREPHWPVPRKLAGVLPFKWGMLHRLTAALIPPYVHPSPVTRWTHSIGRPLVWIFWRTVELLLRVQFGLGTKISMNRNLVPSRPVEQDCFRDSTMVPRPGFTSLIREGRIVAHRTEIERFTDRGLILKEGGLLEVDCVLFGTGWKSDHGFLPAAIRDALGDAEDGFYLYRHILHPDVPNLAFIGRASTFLSIATFTIQARWLAEAIAGRVALPDREAMLEEIERLRSWKRSWMPCSPTRSARLLLHMTNYHDELLCDMGIMPYRKRGIFAPLKELLAPYQSSDYCDVASGTWRRSPPPRDSRETEVPTRSASRAPLSYAMRNERAAAHDQRCHTGS